MPAQNWGVCVICALSRTLKYENKSALVYLNSSLDGYSKLLFLSNW